ncbi:hypothetical protein P378_00815 [Desulforamulus profundi]|uniref:Uncharacterized protein n=1 Tax=Desulforamulus profundi TaxID=1383067 RepID=A0A2C6MJ88_9FIRM|nr:hypothetical protein P378_00815 [Desulforamulus profundi]
MLQQTRVDTALAYYTRAKNMHKAARQIVEQHQEVPTGRS